MAEEYAFVRITATGRDRLRKLAKKNRRTMGAQADFIIEEEYRRVFQVIAQGELPHPPGAQRMPLLYVKEVSDELDNGSRD